MTELETQSCLPPSDKKVLATGHVYPRRDAMELLNLLHFHQAVIESAAVGIIIVDDDTRIINANRASLEITGINLVDVLNRPIADLFSTEERIELVRGLKLVKRQPELKKFSFFATHRSQVVGTSISAFALNDSFVGWVVVLEPAWHGDPKAPLT
jgi:PAS domain S-box-containing protein